VPTFLATPHFTLQGLDLLFGFLLYFFVFGVIGWLVEMLYLSTAGRGLINSGFLQGPVCPAYAAGALIIYPFTVWFMPLPFWLQCLLYAGLATVVEYVAHIALEKVLGIRIWDYSDEFLNLHGRISLKYTVFWFFLVLLLVLVLQPAIVFLIQLAPSGLRLALAAACGVGLAFDYVLSSVLFARMKATIAAVCKAFSLPFKELQDLQFNRPRIMNEKKRLAKLFSDQDYTALAESVERRLFDTREVLLPGFDPTEYADIIASERYQSWREGSDRSRAVYARYWRIAELSYAFCTAIGLDGRAAARGVLLSAYHSTTDLQAERLMDFLFQQWRIVYAVYKDLGPVHKTELDVILRYKWPLNFGPPRTKESLVASFAEKLVQSREYRRELRALYARAFDGE